MSGQETPPALLAALRWDESEEARRLKKPLVIFSVILVFIEFAQLPLTELNVFGVSFGGAQADGVLRFAALLITALAIGWLIFCIRDLLLLYHLVATAASIRVRLAKPNDGKAHWTPQHEMDQLEYSNAVEQEASQRSSPYNYSAKNHRGIVLFKGLTVLFQVGVPLVLYLAALRVTFSSWGLCG